MDQVHESVAKKCIACIANRIMKQLDVDVSPPANIMTFMLISTHVAFDPDPCDP